MTTEPERRAAIEAAFEYRGDVTLKLSGGRSIEGYIFDRFAHSDFGHSFVRMVAKDDDQRLTIAYPDIESIQFTGKDAAAGKSWERWVEHYTARKRAGLDAGLFPENNDDEEDGEEWMGNDGDTNAS